MSDIYLARQPIFDNFYQLHGYELLFRNGHKPVAEYDSEDQASSKVLLASIVDLGLEKVTAGKPCYINVTKEYVSDVINLPIGNNEVILEMQVRDVFTNEQRRILEQARAKGFKLALDRYHPDITLDDLLQHFDYLKCNTQKLSGAQLELIIELAKQNGCKTIATHIEEYHLIPDLLKLGFDYIQGFFLSKPEIKEEKTVQTTLLPVVQMLARILDPELEIEELEGLISSDVNLSYRVLRLLKSAQYNVKDVDSISRAIVYLGRDAIKNLAILIILTGVDEKPDELSKLALVRAKMCALLAESVGMNDINSYFTVGLLSVLDALLDRSVEDILKSLSLNEELSAALTGKGIKGSTLQCVIDYEQCRLDQNQKEHLEVSELTTHYLQAVEWAEETFSQLVL